MKAIARWIGWALLLGIALQLFFIARIAVMASVDPASTAFERSEAWRQLRQDGQLHWRQQWRPLAQISQNLQRAVIASEDDDFVNHDGVLWDAIEKARARNAKAMERAEQRQEKAVARAQAQAERRGEAFDPSSVQAGPPVKIMGGSTITQQLAKNLLLSSERSLLRKGQELLLTYSLEFLLTKQRILELYLNHAEWGDGIFGAEAAAQRYFGKSAAQLNAYEAARLAVMLPNPKGADKNPNSAYLNRRTATIAARMRYAELP
ncbi:MULTISPECIES: transglycosylase domain-containing protein [unclassified Comamonas]|uniref:transglycosylase domain-containing protein n=1 Tax=unclassified Comamonas TaxID=2638500 RepID=UPI002896A338|nr:transglycosylase domain-containing protein [Comamonas sp.]